MAAGRYLLLVVVPMLVACGASDEAETQASRRQDMQRGELLSYACQACHTLSAGGSHQIGPNLHGVFGRTAGTLPDFEFSTALGESGLVWTPEALDRWLADPTGFMPGTTMAFAGYQAPEDRAALIRYLVAVTSR